MREVEEEKERRRAAARAEQIGREDVITRARRRKREHLPGIGADRVPGGLSKGQVLEAREIPMKWGKETEMHVSGSQEREAVSGYFDKLERQDKHKHKLAVSVIRREEEPRPAVQAWADGTDRRDARRDDRFFDKMARYSVLLLLSRAGVATRFDSLAASDMLAGKTNERRSLRAIAAFSDARMNAAWISMRPWIRVWSATARQAERLQLLLPRHTASGSMLKKRWGSMVEGRLWCVMRVRERLM